MSLATYSDLTAAVANWYDRSDTTFTNRVPEFVTLVESNFNRELRHPQMTTVNQAFPFAGEFVPLPADFLEPRDFYLNVNPRVSLIFLPPDQQTDYYSASGTPKYYSVVGRNFRFAPIPNGNFTGTLIYYQAIPSLQANTQNWLMTAYPNLYLFACNLQAAIFLKDDAALQKWAPIYQSELQSVKDSGNKLKYSATGMAVRAAGTIV